MAWMGSLSIAIDCLGSSDTSRQKMFERMGSVLPTSSYAFLGMARLCVGADFALTWVQKTLTFCWMFKKILVPGGHGFLGRSIVDRLRAQGYEAIPVSKRDGVDFLNQEQTTKLFEKEKPDAVINCAAVIGRLAFVHEQPGHVIYQNTLLNLHLMEAARLAGVQLYVNPLANC